MAQRIIFVPTNLELEELKRNIGCDYLIYIAENVINESARTLSFPNQIENSGNRASVLILINELNAEILTSSLQLYEEMAN